MKKTENKLLKIAIHYHCYFFKIGEKKKKKTHTNKEIKSCKKNFFLLASNWKILSKTLNRAKKAKIKSLRNEQLKRFYFIKLIK